ncbi:hypothetical protein IPL68_00215 [Candidatus Saccharibacteria bacterium]|nr:MAG: hypothetical protein IPL68_00215 [Candidatus Saccharibacteria bacterium]
MGQVFGNGTSAEYDKQPATDETDTKRPECFRIYPVVTHTALIRAEQKFWQYNGTNYECNCQHKLAGEK